LARSSMVVHDWTHSFFMKYLKVIKEARFYYRYTSIGK